MIEEILEAPIGESIPTVEFTQRLAKAHAPGEHWSTTCLKCTDVTYPPRAKVPEGTPFEHSYPIRCEDCDPQWTRLRRMLKLKDKVIFCHQELSKPAVGFLTLNLKGWQDSYFRNAPVGQTIPRIKEARLELYTRWTKFWRNYLKSHCVGAYRFFEWTERVDVVQEHIDDTDPTTVSHIIHPHLHVLVLQEGKSIDITELRSAAIAAGFGEQIDMQWKPKARTLGSVDYVLSYVKKDLQIDGRNRQGYGVFHKNSTQG